MTVQRQHKPFVFSDGSQVEVWQASWDMSMDRREIEENARAEKDKEGADPELLFFQEMIYAPLAACSVGTVPVLQDAFHLSPTDLDCWFDEVRCVNPNWFDPGEFVERVVQLSDGTTLTVQSKRPSVIMRRFHLDLEVDKQQPLEGI